MTDASRDTRRDPWGFERDVATALVDLRARLAAAEKARRQAEKIAEAALTLADPEVSSTEIYMLRQRLATLSGRPDEGGRARALRAIEALEDTSSEELALALEMLPREKRERLRWFITGEEIS